MNGMPMMTPLLFLLAAAAGIVLLADAAVRSWNFPGRVDDPGWFWARPAPSRSPWPIGPLRPPLRRELAESARARWTDLTVPAAGDSSRVHNCNDASQCTDTWTRNRNHPSLQSGHDVADALQSGVGSLRDVLQTPYDPAAAGLLTETERAAAEHAWIHAYEGRVAWELSSALDAFRIAIEPAMRKARGWELRGQEGRGAAPSARAELDRWRIETPTGEWPIVRPRPAMV